MIVTYHNTDTDDREWEKKGRGGSCYWRDRKGTRHVTTRFGDDWAQHRHDDDLVVLFDSSPPSPQTSNIPGSLRIYLYTRRSLWDWKILNPGAGCQSNVGIQHFFTWYVIHTIMITGSLAEGEIERFYNKDLLHITAAQKLCVSNCKTRKPSAGYSKPLWRLIYQVDIAPMCACGALLLGPIAYYIERTRLLSVCFGRSKREREKKEGVGWVEKYYTAGAPYNSRMILRRGRERIGRTFASG